MTEAPKPADRTLAENVEASVELLDELIENLRAIAAKLERTRAAVDAELDLIKTADVLIRKIQKFQEHHVAMPKEGA